MGQKEEAKEALNQFDACLMLFKCPQGAQFSTLCGGWNKAQKVCSKQTEVLLSSTPILHRVFVVISKHAYALASPVMHVSTPTTLRRQAFYFLTWYSSNFRIWICTKLDSKHIYIFSLLFLFNIFNIRRCGLISHLISDIWYLGTWFLISQNVWRQQRKKLMLCLISIHSISWL